MKKTYIIPSLAVIEMEAENMLALSVGTAKDGNGTTLKVDAEDALSNKRQPGGSTWGSQNWNTDGE